MYSVIQSLAFIVLDPLVILFLSSSTYPRFGKHLYIKPVSSMLYYRDGPNWFAISWIAFMHSSCWEVSTSPASPCNVTEVSFNCRAIFLPHEFLALNMLILLYSNSDRNGMQWCLQSRASHAKAPFSASNPPVTTSLAHAGTSLFQAMNSSTASLINSRQLLQSRRWSHLFFFFAQSSR